MALFIVLQATTSTTLGQQSADFGAFVTIAVGVSGILVGAAGFIFGFYQYAQNRIQQIKATVFELVQEFENKNQFEYATLILDDYYLNPEDRWFNHDPRYYGRENLRHILRDHRSEEVRDPGEIAIRQSFDLLLLAFFGRLWYLHEIGLIKDKELGFFDYYLDKAAGNDAVMAYTRTYPVPFYNGLVRFRSGQSKG